MIALINNAATETWIFTALLAVFLLLFIKRPKNVGFFPPKTTQELKGLAILAVLLAHIGYYLVNDHRFLFPLSILAGVGLDLFLFLSGFGLTLSQLKNNLTPTQFYKRRLLKIFIPFWLSLALFLILDWLILKITYAWPVILQAIFGIFLQANLYTNINSPYWYLTMILFYYLVFPLVFMKKKPWLSALIIYLITSTILLIKPTVIFQVIGMYEVHAVAFPLGMLFAWLIQQPQVVAFANLIKSKLANQTFKKILYYLILLGLMFVTGYFAYHSGVGQGPIKEQTINLIILTAILIIFLLKKIDFGLLALFGLYSYEIYLLHWPLMYRYDLLYKNLPASLATAVYLLIFLGLGWCLKKLADLIAK